MYFKLISGYKKHLH